MEKYLRQTEKLRERARSIDVFENIDRFGQFSFFSANLTNFMPLLAADRHIDTFQEAYLNQQLCLLDDQYFTSKVPMPIRGWREGTAEMLKAEPGVICTLHAGSYRILSYLLTVSRMPFAILMAGDTAKTQGPLFRSRYAEWQRNNGGDGELPIIPADDPRAIWQIVRLLRSGHQLLFYLDGFSGLPADMASQLQRLPFLAQHLYIRKGAAVLAQKAGVPLYPINNIRQDDGSLLVVADDPVRPVDMPAQDYAAFALPRVFSFFSNQIMHAPAQWENWFFMHFQVDAERLILPDPLRVVLGDIAKEALPQVSDYGVYRHGNGYYLLEKKGYKSYRMDKANFSRLWSFWKENTI